MERRSHDFDDGFVRQQRHPGDRRGRRTPWVLALVALFSLALGTALGWWIGSSRGETTDSVRVDGGKLTARQSQMVDAVREFKAAWVAGDVAAVEKAFASDGVFVFMGQEYRLADGGIAPWVELTDWSKAMTSYTVSLVGSRTVMTMHNTSGSV